MAPVTIETTLRPEGPTTFSCSVIVRYNLSTFPFTDTSRLRIRITLQDSVTKAPITVVAHDFEDSPSQDLLLPGSVLVQRDLGAAIAQKLHDKIALLHDRFALFSPPHLEITGLGSTSGHFTLHAELIRPTVWDKVVHTRNGTTIWLLKEWQVIAKNKRTVVVESERQSRDDRARESKCDAQRTGGLDRGAQRRAERVAEVCERVQAEDYGPV